VSKTSPQDRSTISPLRQRMIEDMAVRNFVEKTRNDYIRQVSTFTAFLGRSPDTATPEDLSRYQLHQKKSGVRPPSMNSAVAALRFFFTTTLDRPEMARHLTFVREPRKIPVILSLEEVARLLEAAFRASSPAGSFLGGFRTPATAHLAPSFTAGVRNSAQLRKLERMLTASTGVRPSGIGEGRQRAISRDCGRSL
jgi:site-specific recombinase XerD